MPKRGLLFSYYLFFIINNNFYLGGGAESRSDTSQNLAQIG